MGKEIVRRALPFGLRVVGNDIREVSTAFIRETGVHMVPLDDLLQQADFVSLACDLNPTSYHLIGERQLQLMKPTACLINTARGPVVEEKALVEALQQHTIAGAALDVFEVEPLPPDSGLRFVSNCIFAPHNAYNTREAATRVHENTIHSLIEELKAAGEHAERNDESIPYGLAEGASENK